MVDCLKCPSCDEELDCDEVDIGVGTMKGNYRCPNPDCGWAEKREMEDA